MLIKRDKGEWRNEKDYKKMMSYVYGLSTKYKLPKLNIAEITDLSVESVSRILTVMELADKRISLWTKMVKCLHAQDVGFRTWRHLESE